MTEDETSNKPTRPMAIRFDIEEWMPYLKDSDLTYEQKVKFVQTLWETVLGFVDLGFYLNPTQEICGEVIDLKAVLEVAVLNSEPLIEQTKGDAA